MGVEIQSSEIGGVTYHVAQFGAKKGRQVMVVLSRVLGPALGGAASSQGKGAEATLGMALERASSALTEADFDRLCDTFAEFTTFTREVKASNGTVTATKVPLAPEFDTHFRGRYMAMCEWFAFCVRVNFADFLGGIGSLANRVGLTRTDPATDTAAPATPEGK